MATKKKVDPLEKRVRQLTKQNQRLERLSGLLWMYRTATGTWRQTVWDELVAAHDTHRKAVTRGR